MFRTVICNFFLKAICHSGSVDISFINDETAYFVGLGLTIAFPIPDGNFRIAVFKTVCPVIFIIGIILILYPISAIACIFLLHFAFINAGVFQRIALTVALIISKNFQSFSSDILKRSKGIKILAAYYFSFDRIKRLSRYCEHDRIIGHYFTDAHNFNTYLNISIKCAACFI